MKLASTSWFAILVIQSEEDATANWEEEAEMKFELTQQLRTQADLETIILVLAEQVKSVSAAIDVTDEGVITATRIQPSIASLLRFDRTIISVETNEDRVLLIANGSCRPTALFWVILILCIPTFVAWLLPIGIYMYQKGVLKSAVEAMFKRVKDELEVMAPTGSRGRNIRRDSDQLDSR